MKTAKKDISIGGKFNLGSARPFFLIAGPCVLENRDHAFFLAGQIKEICRSNGVPFIFKASFDKANRSSIRSYRGPGLEKGLKILASIKEELDIPVLSDIHETRQVSPAAEVLDVIQIPAFLCRQTDLITEAARTRKPLNIKKGQFLSPPDMKNIIEKIRSQDNEQIMLTERGTCFGYNNLIVDIRSIPLMKRFGYPVVLDASHSTQKPGGQGFYSGGEAEFISLYARAGICAGADGIFIEVHENPSKALSDKHNSLILNKLDILLKSLLCLGKAQDSIKDYIRELGS
ncbi:MAG: 3-deoxy-8-phosphooctulonate synthase [Candidatus Aminicenantes bacterium]|nr:3-deoxy-8-phosphooctulonate synthase [Candidatus Aminicenantes bacterium]